ncbi:MAG: sigma 54-interacting transcriptional regulator [Holophaga sp.]|nr:sigma 54-interacting transcriptional regulator [Holophaga sp.]
MAEVIEELLAGGLTLAQVVEDDGCPCGTFDLVAFLGGPRAGGAWGTGEAVERHLAKAGSPAEACGTLAGIEPWRALLLTALSLGPQPAVALLGESARVLFANKRMCETFPEAFASPRVLLGNLLPDHPPAWTKSNARSSFRFIQQDERCFLAILSRKALHSLRGLVLFEFTERLSQFTERLSEEHRNALDEVDLLRRVLDIGMDGLQVINPEGIITMVNKSYLKIHNVARSECEGLPVTQVIENTRMHIVAHTGVPELDEIQKIRGHTYVVSRIPIFKGGKCIGAVGKIVFQNLQEIHRLAFRTRRLQLELEELRKSKGAPRRDTRFSFDDIVAQADASRLAKDRASMGAPTTSTILLLGESGVGKEVFAQAIHNLSPRYSHPFVRVNCSAITESLFESELFGYAEGAFTDARKGGRTGKFEQAQGGTIFLDEIGDMPLSTQAKLLRVLQEREIDKVGGEGTLPVDIRVIAATNQDLWELVEQEKFRRDLFFRLNVIPIVIPPLRERRADIPDLIQLFWSELQAAQGIHTRYLTPGACRLLEEYSWPGNIRELRNTLERTFTIVQDNQISESQVRMIMLSVGFTGGQFGADDTSLDGVVEKAERKAIALALARTNNNKAQAAKLLGISRPLLYRKMGQYSIS